MINESKERLAKEIGHKLKEAREDLGLSREKVGAALGLSEQGYGHIEAGRNLLSIDYLLKLPYIFHKPITFFLPGYAITEAERNDIMHDPHLRRILDAWPKLEGRDRLKEAAANLIEHVASHKQPPQDDSRIL